MSKEESELSIVERSSGYWIVDDDGVAWDEPFDDLTEATKKLEEIKEDEQTTEQIKNTRNPLTK